MSTINLPLRLTARVLIVKSGRICLGRVWNDLGRIAHYTFPGGGVEEGDTHVSTLKKECLEKVGIAIHQIEKLDLVVTVRHPMGSPNHKQIWGGSITHYYKAEWERYDHTQRNAVGDAMHYTWELPNNALKVIRSGPVNPANDALIEAIQVITEMRPSGRLQVVPQQAAR